MSGKEEPLLGSSINSPNSNNRNKKIIAAVASVVGVVFISLGIFFYFFIGTELQKGLEDTMVVDGYNHPEYEAWLTNLDSDDSIEYYKVSVFNITNLNDVLAGSIPALQEVGPYYYRTYSKKLNVTFRDTPYGPDKSSGDVVRYREYEYYIYQEENSGAGLNPLTDVVTVPNFAFFALGPVAGPMFRPITVNDLLWNNVLTLPGNTKLDLSLVTNYTSEEDCYNRCQFDAFRTGKDDPNTIGYQVLYADESFCFLGVNACWASPERIEGTDGSIFPYNSKKGDTLVTWLPDALRTVSLKHYGDANQKVEGIELYRFRVDKNGFLNTTYSTRNEKYYQVGPNGLVDMKNASSGLPVYLSQPHFYNCDPALTQQVSGLNPNQRDHDTFIDVEPISGYTMNAAKRLQVTFYVQITPTTPDPYKSVRSSFVPMIWIEEGGRVSQESAKDFKDSVYFAQDLQIALIVTGCVVGFFSLVTGLYLTYRIRKEDTELGIVY